MVIFIYLTVILLCLFFQGFFSGSETALISCNKLKIRKLARSGDIRAQKIEALLATPGSFLSTTLVGTNIFLVLSSVMATKLAFYFLQKQELASVVTTLVMTPIILIFAELIPKSVFLHYADTISLKIIKPINLTLIVLYPLVKISMYFTGILTKILGANRNQEKNPFVNRNEIELLLEEGKRQGVLKKEEHRMIEQAFNFGETDVKAVMVPLVMVHGVEINRKVGDVLPIFREKGFSQIPLYEERIDNIVGIVEIKNLLGISEKTSLREVAQEILITPENKSIEELLTEMKEQNKNLAVAVDEFGGVSGILTMEDIIEEIVGEIRDEYEPRQEEIVQKGEGYILNGDVRLDELEEKLLLNLPEGDYVTLSGLITTYLGRISKTGEKFNFNNIQFEILESTDRVIKKVKVEIVDKKKI